MYKDIFRLDLNVPDYYVSESRDFLVLTRILTALEANVKYNIDSSRHLNNPELINSGLLKLLCTKVGFFTNKKFSDEELRTVCSAFCDIVFNKGSLLSIVLAVQIFCKVNEINSNTYIYIDNLTYTVNVGFSIGVKDAVLLQEIFRYIIPAGYIINIFIYEEETSLFQFWNADTLTYLSLTYDDSSKVRNMYNDKFIWLNRVDTTHLFIKLSGN